MSEYSLDDAIYVAVIRSSEPKDGHEVRLLMDAFKEAGIKPVTQPAVVAFEGRECSSQKHDALRALGFTFEYANSHIPVVMQSLSPEEAALDGRGADDAGDPGGAAVVADPASFSHEGTHDAGD